MNLLVTLLLSFLVIVTVVTAMAVGVMAGRQPIKGSCGGLSNIPGIESDCGGLCRAKGGKPREACHRHSRSCADDGRAGLASTHRWTSNGNTP